MAREAGRRSGHKGFRRSKVGQHPDRWAGGVNTSAQQVSITILTGVDYKISSLLK